MMRLFKFLFYGSAFFIGLTIAFCANTNYDTKIYPSPPSLPTFESTSKIESATPLIQQGKKLFKANCASCHNRNMIDDLTGPALAGTLDRWKGREDLLYQWIRNAPKVIAAGDSYALGLYNKWNKTAMTAFPNLTDEELEALLAYVER